MAHEISLVPGPLIFSWDKVMAKLCHENGIGRFQERSIPIPRTAFWISEGNGEGGVQI